MVSNDVHDDEPSGSVLTLEEFVAKIKEREEKDRSAADQYLVGIMTGLQGVASKQRLYEVLAIEGVPFDDFFADMDHFLSVFARGRQLSEEGA